MSENTREHLMYEAESSYLKSINKIMLWAMLAHIPIMAIVSSFFNTGIFTALIMATLIASLPTVFTLFSQNHRLTAISYGVGFISMSGLLIHLSKGMIESHFHIFVSLACLIIFANPWVILAAAATAAVHHIGFYFFLPQSLFNYQASFLIVVVHAVFVVLETIPCMWIAQKFKTFIVKQGVVLGNIETLSRTMNVMISKLNTNNQELFNSSESQGAAVTETAQTMHEISQMAVQTADNAEISKNISEKGKQSAEVGKRAVGEMLHSIDNIKKSNSDVLSQIKLNNDELEQIVGVIKQIESKAQIINEIVFQTKLLSFNASVEAARAGEHGKGFAVVAEEVGNLAAMSGNASKEISELINTSVQKVETIASETEKKINELVHSAQKSINEGSDKAQNCGNSLEELAEIVNTVNTKIYEISDASKEQSMGITEISKTIQNLENLNIKNRDSIKTSVNVSQELNTLSQNLTNLVEELSLQKGS